jgi:cytochrome P450 / NADPH-cytochrome P450 reductase
MFIVMALLAILRETLRLSPPAVIRMVAPVEDTTLSVGDKKYDVKAGQIVAINAMTSHHDPAVYGPDVRCLFLLLI